MIPFYTHRFVLVVLLLSALWTQSLSFLRAEAVSPLPTYKTTSPARPLLAPPCQFIYPMTARNTTVPVTPGTDFDILDGASNHGLSSTVVDRGFLAWDPNIVGNAAYLEEELIYPELSLTGYTNANDANDHELDTGSYVKSLPGNNGAVGSTLDGLVGQDIIIPVWDTFNTTLFAYHMSGFVRVRIPEPAPIGINLTTNNPVIMATYLGPVDPVACPLLSITKVGPPVVTAGSLITYTLTVSNDNEAMANNLVITDAVPAGANYIQGGSLAGSVVSWTAPSLAGNQSLTRTFSVTATQTVTNSLYRVSQEFYLGGTGLYSATGQVDVVTLVLAPSLTITKHGPLTATAGSLITYTLTVTNEGTLTASNLVITDALPIGANYVSGGSLVGDVVSWTVPSLAIDQSLTRTFSITAGATITNSLYRVSADHSISATGQASVVTAVTEEIGERLYLPIIMKKK